MPLATGFMAWKYCTNIRIEDKSSINSLSSDLWPGNTVA